MSAMNTFTGRIFDPLKMMKQDVCVEDIAHALSLVCRGGGHIRYFFSVAQHSMNCASEAAARGWSGRIVLACLLHDASEAYMSDVPRPFKKYLKDYKKLEDRLLSLVYEKYLGSDITEAEARLVKQIDNDILAYDLFYLLDEGCKEDLPEMKRPFSYEVRSFESVAQEYLELFQKWMNK